MQRLVSSRFRVAVTVIIGCCVLKHGDALASCPDKQIIFYCVTKNQKEVLLCDRGENLEYAFGKTLGMPELALSIPRGDATTFQWKGIGSWISYSVTIQNGDTKYTLYSGLNRVSEEHEYEAGIDIATGNWEVTRILCENPVTHNIEGIDLKQEN